MNEQRIEQIDNIRTRLGLPRQREGYPNMVLDAAIKRAVWAAQQEGAADEDERAAELVHEGLALLPETTPAPVAAAREYGA